MIGTRNIWNAMAKITGRKRHSIRKSQASALFAGLCAQIGESAALFMSDRVEILETNAGFALYLIDKKPQLMDSGEWVFPTLQGLLEHPFPERRIVVDSGAVPFVVNGADIMRPGIVSVTEDVKAGCPVQVVEERHGKPLALGVALYDAGDLMGKTSGKMVKTFHYIGDDLWNVEF
jgi:PUA domain protein